MAQNDSTLNLANRVLQRLGADPITSLTTTVDTSTRAAVMSRLIESTRQAALSSHNWNFSEVKVTLDGFMCTPLSEFDCAYLMPTNYLHLRETSLDEEDAYRVEMHLCAHNNTCNLVLVTDSACNPVITYTVDLTDITKWSPLFTYALELQLAADAAYPITRNAGLAQEWGKQAEAAWRKAKSRDGQEGRFKKPWLSNVLLRARLPGGRRPDRTDL